MSFKGSGLLTNHAGYISTHVGGKTKEDKNQEYIKNQNQILKNLKDKVPQSYDPPYDDMYTSMSGLIGQRYPMNRNRPVNDRYDPLGDFMFKHGLLDRDNVTRYITEYINIDSSDRNKIPTAETDNWVNLSNPFYINKVDNILTVKQPNHNFQVNDKVSITGVLATTHIIKNKVNGVKKIDFTAGSQYMTISFSHGLDFDNSDEAQPYDTSDLYVSIEGITGYPGTSYVNNIPINTINGRQRIYIVQPDTLEYSKDIFYIKLIKKFVGTYNPGTFTLKLTFLYIGGIPINRINAEYPIDINHQQGYHIVSAVKTDSYEIELYKQPATNINGFGGPEVYSAKVLDVQQAYPDANSYTITLGKTYENIVMARLVSSEFPNTEKVIKDVPEKKKNNLFYWQNIDDGDFIYSIEMDHGNYKPENLIAEFEKKVSLVQRVNLAALGDTTSTSYTNKNFIQMTINTDTDLVTFQSFREAQLDKPFIEVTPSIDLKGSNNIFTSSTYAITIQQKNHGLSEGDTIIISGAIEYYGISADIINGQKVVSEIVDIDRYKIEVSHFNLSSQRTDSGGGSAITIFAPNIFRILFNKPNTFGTLLGFRKVGDPGSVTPYASTITNNDAYEFEQTIDELGNPVRIKNNSVRISGDNYLYMVCTQIKGMTGEGAVKDAFSKIQLTGLPGRILFNTFVQAPIYFHSPIPQLSDLEFNFYSPDGELYDFNGIDHSFTIELTILSEIPKGTGISPDSGKIN